MIEWDKLEGRTLKNRYEIQGVIGQGGAGKVYLANDLLENKQVAIKTSNPYQTMSNYKERFKMEAKTMSKLSHPNIVKFYEYFEIDNIEMIAMEYVEGISLESKLKKAKQIDPTEALVYTRELLSALQEVHSHKVFHRDIKTDNIHITVDGTVKLLDFGIVQETLDQDLTRQGSVIGTVSYMAPEIIKSTYKKANERTDIYSVGVMLYQLLTGAKPFIADSGLIGNEKNTNLARKIAFEPPVAVNEINISISKQVNHFVMKMIEKEPSDRYQNTKDALEDINKIIEGSSVDALKGYYEVETKDYSMKKQIIIITLVIAVILILLSVAILIVLFF